MSNELYAVDAGVDVEQGVAFNTYPYVALVTGASRGIGLELVRQLALGRASDEALQGFATFDRTDAEGKSPAAAAPVPSAVPADAIIIGAARTPATAQALQALAAECPRVRIVALDLDDDASLRAAAAQVAREYGRLDLLIHNAGVAEADAGAMPSNADRSDALRVFGVNSVAPLLCTNAFAPLLALTHRNKTAAAGGAAPTVLARSPHWRGDADNHIAREGVVANANAAAARAAKRMHAGDQSAEDLAAIANSHVRVAFVGSSMGSVAGCVDAFSPVYRASKAALTMMVRCIQLERPWLAVAVLHPGWVHTDMGARGGREPPLTPAKSVACLVELINRMRADEDVDGARAYNGYVWPL